MKKLQENCMDTIEVAILEGETYYSASHKFLITEILNKALTGSLYSSFDRIYGFIAYLEAEEEILQGSNKLDMKKIVNKCKKDTINYINAMVNGVECDFYSYFNIKSNDSSLDSNLLELEEKVINSLQDDVNSWKDKLEDYYKSTKIHDLQAQREFNALCEKIKVA